MIEPITITEQIDPRKRTQWRFTFQDGPEGPCLILDYYIEQIMSLGGRVWKTADVNGFRFWDRVERTRWRYLGMRDDKDVPLPQHIRMKAISLFMSKVRALKLSETLYK